jgi:hypothetical protein
MAPASLPTPIAELRRWLEWTERHRRTEVASIRPEALVRWHRAGFRCYWRWKSLRREGRPQIETELRALIRRMSIENPLCCVNKFEG